MSPIATKPGGTFCDVGIRNVNQDGDETLEVWLQEVVSGSGTVQDGAGGSKVGATNFSEFPVASGIPTGITTVGPSLGGSCFDVFEIVDGGGDIGHYFVMGGTQSTNCWLGFQYDAFGDSIGVYTGEILARVWVEKESIGASNRGLDVAFCVREDGGGTLRFSGANVYTRSAGDFEVEAHDYNLTKGLADISEVEQPAGAWMWIRFQRTTEGANPYTHRAKAWYGDVADEPAAWDLDINPGGSGPGDQGAIGWALSQAQMQDAIDDPDQHRIAFLSFSSDPSAQSAPTPDDIPTEDGVWFLAGSFPVAAGEDQVVRIEDLASGAKYHVALRYRRGTKYNAGAEDTDDPTTWPSVSQGQFTTTVDPPTFVSAVWSRTAVDAEQIVLTVTPENPDDAIAVYREKEGDGAPTRIGEIAGPHGATADFTDTTIEGEAVYFYSFATVGSAGDGGQSDQERIWSGPPAIPVFRFYTAEGGGYGVAFEDPADDTQGLELHDTYDNVGGTSPFFSLRSEIDPIGILTEIFSGELSNIPSPDITFQGKIRFTQTASGTEDFGEFSPAFNVTVPESGGVA